MPFDLAIFVVGAFVAALVAGLAGFAFGIIAAAIWLHALVPSQAIPLIVAYALLVQGYAVWKLRHAINLGRLVPFVAGSAVGVPFGVVALSWASVAALRSATGLLLILFSFYALARPKLPEVRRAGVAVDGTIGVFNGVLGGSTGLAGILPVIWCGLRGWTKDEQRAVFQPTAVATFLLTIIVLGGTGALSGETVTLFAVGLPALVLGTWCGWKLYGRLDEAAFRKIVLVLVLASGFALISGSW